MNFDRINEQLHKIKTTKKIEDIHTLVGFFVESFGVTQCNPEELFMHASVQREVSRFMSAQGFRNQAAAYTIPHQSGIPLDIKLFWLKKTTKANLSWVMALTPNYEDNPETNTNLNIGIDIVVSENCDSVFIVLSNNLKARVLELNGSLSLTQREIFDNWVKIGRTINRESENFKKEFHTLLWKSFDFEPINRKFYLQLVEQFDHLVGHITKTITDQEKAKMFAVRLIGRTLFLWFLRKKEFVNPEFDYFTVSGDADQTEYYREKLEPLFFEVLNTEIKERSFADKITTFLNGGLFEPIDTDFYKDSKLTFPTGFFTQIFNVLNHYNFTVDEGTSEYEQVAVDPEMLGRVFENLLASLNDETGNQARKSKGAFYTPREIVDYMCEQSLVEYLKTKLPETANRDRRIEELVTMDEASFREQDHNKRRDWKKDLGQEQVVQALDELKILDPAVGSGAFPMGMLNLLVKVYTRIDTAREKDLAQLKRDILSRSLYGVDIDQMAIQISRLRAWLSILVDMENLKKAEPLPNLDFKFVCANTLIPLGKNSGLATSNDEFDLKEKLIEIRDSYYSENRKSFKKKLRDNYLDLIKKGGLFDLLESDRDMQLKDYNPFNPLNSSSFYDPTLMHGVEAFDVVIGNPPYVGFGSRDSAKISKKEVDLIKKIYENSAEYKINLYPLFMERGIRLTKNNGIQTYITPDSFLLGRYFSKIRNYIITNCSILKILLFSDKVFNATVGYSVVYFFKKQKNNQNSVFVSNVNSSDLHKINFFDYDQSVFNSTDYNRFRLYFDKKTKNIIEKIDKDKIKLGDVFTGRTGIRSKIGQKNIIYKEKKGENYKQGIISGGQILKYGIVYNNDYINVDPTILNGGGFDFDIINNPKILLRQTSDKITGSIDYNNYYHLNNVHSFAPNKNSCGYDLKFIIAILNSKLIEFYYQNISLEKGRAMAQIDIETVENFPLPKIDDNKIILIQKLVDQIQEKKKNNIKANTSDLESQVDELVMDLYGLNEEEKEIIRNS